MLNFHLNKKSDFTMALFNCSNPRECGIAELDNNNYIINFEEKPSNPQSTLANAGIYLANYKIF